MSLFTDMVFWLINYWRHANMKPLYWLKALYCLHFEWISHVIKHPTLSHNSYSNGFFTWWPAASVTCLSSFLVSRDNKCSDLILFKDLKLCILKSCFIYLFGCFFYQLFKYVYLFIYPCRADRRYLIKWTLVQSSFTDVENEGHPMWWVWGSWRYHVPIPNYWKNGLVLLTHKISVGCQKQVFNNYFGTWSFIYRWTKV